MQKGFTFIEIIIAIAILAILGAISVTSVNKARESKEIIGIVDGIVAKLDQAHGDSISGKSGSNFGVKFSIGSYTYFSGSSYSSSNPDNKVININSSFELSNTIANADDAIIFSRISGDVGSTATVTVSHISGSVDPINIVIGNLGEISVVK